MGKSPKPLNILVHPDLLPWPELEALREQGHTVDVMADGGTTLSFNLAGYNIIFSRTAWYMTDAHKPYLSHAVKTARLVKYPRKK